MIEDATTRPNSESGSGMKENENNVSATSEEGES